MIVAQFSDAAHAPSVFGTWATRRAADEAMESMERRIRASFRGDVDGYTISVEPVLGKTVGAFLWEFERRGGYDLRVDNSAAIEGRQPATAEEPT